MLSETKHLPGLTKLTIGYQMLRFTQHDTPQFYSARPPVTSSTAPET